MRTLPLLLIALAASMALQAQQAASPCPTSECFQVAVLECETPVCVNGLQGTVDSARTRGPKVDVKATVTAFMKGHKDVALLLAGNEGGHLALWAYQGQEGSKVTSQFTYQSFADFVKATKGGDPKLAGLLLPEPIWTRLKGAKTLVILPLEGFPKLPFADLKPAGAEQPLGKGRKVTVLKRLEQLSEL